MKAQKVFDQTFTSRNFNTSPLTISYLQGDLYNYTFLMTQIGSPNDSGFRAYINGDTATNYITNYMFGLGGTVAGSAQDGIQNGLTLFNSHPSVTSPAMVLFTIEGESGSERKISSESSWTNASGKIVANRDDFWKNTVDEFTSIEFKNLVSGSFDMTVTIWATPKTASLDGWEPVESQSWTAQDIQATPISFADLVGDTDLEYRLDWEQDSVASNQPLIESNFDGGSNYVGQNLRNTGGSISANNSTSSGWETLQNGETVKTYQSSIINAVSGVKRLCISSASSEAGTRDQNRNAGWWSNTVDEITSLDIVGSATTNSTGMATLYRKKKSQQPADKWNLPFKTLQKVPVSGDFSAGDTLSGLALDLTKLIRISGKFSTVGNDLRIQINSDTGSNYILQYLKGVSGSASTGSATTTFALLCDASVSKVAEFILYLFPASGEVRPALLQVSHGEDSVEFKAIWWDNSVDEIDEFKIYTSSTTATTGDIEYSILE